MIRKIILLVFTYNSLRISAQTLGPTTSEPTPGPTPAPSIAPTSTSPPTRSPRPTISPTLPVPSASPSKPKNDAASSGPASIPSTSPKPTASEKPSSKPTLTRKPSLSKAPSASPSPPTPTSPTPTSPTTPTTPTAPTTPTPPTPTAPSPPGGGGDITALLLCQDTRSIRAGSSGSAHNKALDSINIHMKQESPVDIQGYLKLIKSQAKLICDGDSFCLSNIEDFANQAMNYVALEGQLTPPTVKNPLDGKRRRRLTQYLPENDWDERLLGVIERVLTHVSLETEEEVHSALDDLEKELLNESTPEKMLTINEKDVIDAAISVAKASTSYWHKASHEEFNNFRRLQDENVIDCLFTGDSHIRDEGNRRRLRTENNNRLKPLATKERQRRKTWELRKKSKSSSSDSYDYSYANQDDYWSRCDHCDSWQECERCYGNSAGGNNHVNYNQMNQGYSNGGTYGSTNNFNSGFNNNNMHSGYNNNNQGGGGGYGGQQFDDFFFNPGNPAPSPVQNSVDMDDNFVGIDDTIVDDVIVEDDEPPGVIGRLGNIARNIVFIVRADIMGILVGVIVGRGCVTPGVASSFLFSAVYAVCYRNVL